METPLVELVRSPKIEEFAQLKTSLPEACKDCEFLEFCNGGCPKHHNPIGTDPNRTNHFCEGYKMFFREALGELRRMAEYFRKGEQPPLRPAKAIPAGHAPADAPVGRNDPCPCGSGRKFKNCCGKR